MWLISKKFTFEAAPRLPKLDGKCCRLHGHSWVGIVYVIGDRLETEGAKSGMVIDFSVIKAYLQPLIDDYLDHHYLNETLEMENPTSEKVAKWVYFKLKESGLKNLHSVEIQETCTSSCRFFANTDYFCGLNELPDC